MRVELSTRADLLLQLNFVAMAAMWLLSVTMAEHSSHETTRCMGDALGRVGLVGVRRGPSHAQPVVRVHRCGPLSVETDMSTIFL
jgi:hypothetical protein